MQGCFKSGQMLALPSTLRLMHEGGVHTRGGIQRMPSACTTHGCGRDLALERRRSIRCTTKIGKYQQGAIFWHIAIPSTSCRIQHWESLLIGQCTMRHVDCRSPQKRCLDLSRNQAFFPRILFSKASKLAHLLQRWPKFPITPCPLSLARIFW